MPVADRDIVEVVITVWQGRGLVLLVGWCDEGFFRARAQVAYPGQRLPGGWTLPPPLSYYIMASDLYPMREF